jgi:hypothetical protein
MIVTDMARLNRLYEQNAGPGHTDLSVAELADKEAVLSRYQTLRNEVTKEVATHKMRHGT